MFPPSEVPIGKSEGIFEHPEPSSWSLATFAQCSSNFPRLDRPCATVGDDECCLVQVAEGLYLSLGSSIPSCSKNVNECSVCLV